MDVQGVAERAGCMPLERLEAEITSQAGHLAAAECRWLLFVAEYDRREGWAQWGCWSCARWLGWKCGIARRAAQEKVRVARALGELPLITEEFSRGAAVVFAGAGAHACRRAADGGGFGGDRP